MHQNVLNAAVTAAVLCIATQANAAVYHSYPETANNNGAILPIIHVQHASDHLKANIINPRPVCNAAEDYRTVVYQVRDNFAPFGTISTTNYTNGPIPLTQDLSKSQTITMKIEGDLTEKNSFNLGGSYKGGSVGISHEITRSLGMDFSYSLSWSLGQKIGPYQVPAGHTGEATYGFRTITMTGTQQFCKANGTWSNPTPWLSYVPVKNEVRVQLFDRASASWKPNKPANSSESYGKNYTIPGYTPVLNQPQATTTQAYDLEPVLTSAAGKVPGFAGLVALRIKNVGLQRYYEEFPLIRFRVDIHTNSGPQGVDRLITPGWFNGAYVRDLGFNSETSVRSFEVALSNPILPGEEVLVANFNFGDGATREGRLINEIVVSQVTRLKDDTSYYNDQGISSRNITRSDFGKKLEGLF